MTHICVGNLTIIGSDNGLSPGRRQAIIWTSAGILLIGPIGTNFSEILIIIQTFSFKKMHLKMSSTKWRPFCPGLNVLWPGCISGWIKLPCHIVAATCHTTSCVALVMNKTSVYIQWYSWNIFYLRSWHSLAIWRCHGYHTLYKSA